MKPHMRKRTILGAIAAGGLVAGVAAVADGQQPAVPSPVLAVRDAAIAPPSERGNLDAAHQTSNSALRAHLEPAGRGYLEGSDWSSARSFAIPGTQLRGWTFNQQDKQCLAVPDPAAEGYGVTCNTREEVASGKATVIVTPPTGSGAPNVVGVLEADNTSASIDVPPGTAARFERIGDVSVGIAPSGSHLVTASGKHAIQPPPLVTEMPGPPPVVEPPKSKAPSYPSDSPTS